MSNIYDLEKTGSIIRERRKQLDLSLEQVASACYTTRQTVSKWEKGTGEMTFEQAVKLCNALGCDMGHLLGEYPELTRQAANICQETGLSEAAVNKIVAWKNADDRRKLYSNHLSELLENKDTESLLGDIGEFLAYAALEVNAVNNNDPKFAVELLDLQMARLWNISRVFSNIIEILGAAQNREGDNSNGKA